MTAIALLLGGVMFVLLFVAAYLERIASALDKMQNIGADAMGRYLQHLSEPGTTINRPFDIRPPSEWEHTGSPAPGVQEFTRFPAGQRSPNVGQTSSEDWTFRPDPEEWPK